MTTEMWHITMSEVVRYDRRFTRDELAKVIGCEPADVEDHIDSEDATYALKGENESLIDALVGGYDFLEVEDREWSITKGGERL